MRLMSQQGPIVPQIPKNGEKYMNSTWKLNSLLTDFSIQKKFNQEHKFFNGL